MIELNHTNHSDICAGKSVLSTDNPKRNSLPLKTVFERELVHRRIRCEIEQPLLPFAEFSSYNKHD